MFLMSDFRKDPRLTLGIPLSLSRPQLSERRFLRFSQASNTGDVHPLVEPVSHHLQVLARSYIPEDNGSILTSADYGTAIEAKDYCPDPTRMTV